MQDQDKAPDFLSLWDFRRHFLNNASDVVQLAGIRMHQLVQSKLPFDAFLPTVLTTHFKFLSEHRDEPMEDYLSAMVKAVEGMPLRDWQTTELLFRAAVDLALIVVPERLALTQSPQLAADRGVRVGITLGLLELLVSGSASDSVLLSAARRSVESLLARERVNKRHQAWRDLLPFSMELARKQWAKRPNWWHNDMVEWLWDPERYEGLLPESLQQDKSLFRKTFRKEPLRRAVLDLAKSEFPDRIRGVRK